MSSYPWGGSHNANPYTAQNRHDHVGVQPLSKEFPDSDYSRRVQESDADRTVSSIANLPDAVESTAGGTVWIEKDIYDVSGLPRRIDIPSGTTVAGDGALLVQDEPKNGIFNITNDNVRLCGLRFEGPVIGHVDSYEATRAIMVRGNIEIDNCEFYGFPAAGLYVGEGGEQTEPSEILEPHIHHNVIRDNQESSLGYGVVTYNGDPVIEYNLINNNRHGVAGGGYEYASYRAYNNVHGEDGLIFQFEQHAPGGVRMDVRNNEFRMTEKNNGGTDVRAYAQRGTPQDVASIFNNHIYNPVPPGDQPGDNPDAAIHQYDHDSNDWVNVEFGNNQYGDTDSTDANVGIQPLSSSTAFDGFDGTTDENGLVETQVPGGEYEIVVDHDEYDSTLTETVTVSGEDQSVTMLFGDDTDGSGGGGN